MTETQSEDTAHDATARGAAAGVDRPDRIVMVSDSAFARGGATSLVRRAVRCLRARGHSVTLLCGELGDEAADPLGPLAETGAEVVSLGQGRLATKGRMQAMRSGLWNGAAQGFLAGWIARKDTPGTVYHLHGWAQILSPAAFAALSPVAPRTVLHAHDFFFACPNGVYMDFPRGTVCRRVPLSASCVTTQCDKRSAAQKGWRVLRHGLLRRPLLRAPWGAIALIHPAMAEPLRRGGLDSTRFRTVLNPAAPFSATRIRVEDNRRVAFVGRLDPEKGAADLARAAAKAGLEATFVGEGPDAAAIRAALPSARITGWQPREAIGTHLQDARCLAMPSRLPEPFGLAAAEASLSGLPVVLPQMSLLSAGLSGAGLGLAYDHATPAALASALARMRDMDTAAITEMSLRAASGSEAIAQSEESWITTMERLYQEVLTARAPAGAV